MICLGDLSVSSPAQAASVQVANLEKSHRLLKVRMSMMYVVNRQPLRTLLGGSSLLLFSLGMLFLGSPTSSSSSSSISSTKPYYDVVLWCQSSSNSISSSFNPTPKRRSYDHSKISSDSDTLARCTPPGLAARRRGVHRFLVHKL